MHTLPTTTYYLLYYQSAEWTALPVQRRDQMIIWRWLFVMGTKLHLPGRVIIVRFMAGSIQEPPETEAKRWNHTKCHDIQNGDWTTLFCCGILVVDFIFSFPIIFLFIKKNTTYLYVKWWLWMSAGGSSSRGRTQTVQTLYSADGRRLAKF